MPPAFHRVKRLDSWGRVVRKPHEVAHPAFPDELGALVTSFTAENPGLAVGLRRSYGDSNLNPEGRVIDMTSLDRIVSFDAETGVMRAEAGLSLSQALQVMVPHGWFLPTTPGTRFVTLGGAVANDVHGKNHHSAGNFGNSVRRLKLRRTDGSAHEIGPNDPLFAATVGGLGLTGVIEWVEFQAVRVPSSFVEAEDTVFHNIGEYFAVAREKKAQFEHTMAWVDCRTSGEKLGRGIFSGANWSKDGGLKAHREEPKIKLPVDVPGRTLNKFSIQAFNALYNAMKTMNAGDYRAHYEPFLYPLDAIGAWNRLYGRFGFWQYQCVLPPAAAEDGVKELLKAIEETGEGSFLAVLKDFGAIPGVGMLSFPREGTTLALDFRNRAEIVPQLMARLDDIVREAGGRLYPAKDGRIPAAMFRAGFPQWQSFSEHVDPGLSSAFWRRVSA